MLISIIIPNYNHASYIKKRIESVLNQTYQDFEVIILDDCSTDNSLAIINQYKNHPKIAKIICNETNSGSTFKQWEKGIALAKGEYIWIAESDDYSDDQFLSNAVNSFSANSNVGLFFCNYETINNHDNIISENNLLYDPLIDYLPNDSIINGKVFCEKFLFFSNLILNASAVVFKKNMYSHVDKEYIKMKVAGDWRMWVDICYNTQVIFTKQKLNYYRMHTNNVRTKKALLLPAEGIANYSYFIEKTENLEIRTKLRDNIAKLWIYNFRMNKNLIKNLKLIKKILVVDNLFPFRVLSRIFHKI